MEIEKKYLVKKLPENLEQYEKSELEQCYLCTGPVIRIRKSDDDYILTYKSREGETPTKAETAAPPSAARRDEEALNVCQEIEAPLNREAYEHLRAKADGLCIVKTRYRIPCGKYRIELDVFHGEYEGFYLAEVEFPTVAEGLAFTPPAWFGEDVSGDPRYTNSYLSSHSPEEK